MKKILVSIAAVLLICGAIFTLSSFTSKTETESGSDPYGYVFISDVGNGSGLISVVVELTPEGKAITETGKTIHFKVRPSSREAIQYVKSSAEYGYLGGSHNVTNVYFKCEDGFEKQCSKERDFDVEVTGIK